MCVLQDTCETQSEVMLLAHKKLNDLDHLVVRVVPFLFFPSDERLTGIFGEMLWFTVLQRHTNLFVQEPMQILLPPMDSIRLSKGDRLNRL